MSDTDDRMAQVEEFDLRREKVITAQTDSELTDWLYNAIDPTRHAGSFVRAIAQAGVNADSQNYLIIRPALLAIKAKYPEYAAPRRLGEPVFRGRTA